MGSFPPEGSLTRHPEEGETKRRPGSDVTLSPPTKGIADDPASTVLGAKASAKKPAAAEASPVLAVVVVLHRERG
jgi:hypothetical protein